MVTGKASGAKSPMDFHAAFGASSPNCSLKVFNNNFISNYSDNGDLGRLVVLKS